MVQGKDHVVTASLSKTEGAAAAADRGASDLGTLVDADEDQLWAICARATDGVVFNQLADAIGRKFRNDPVTGREYGEIFLLPILTHASHGAVGEPQVWRSAASVLLKAARIWFGDGGRTTFLQRLVGLEWIGAWRPFIWREHLAWALGEKSTAVVSFQVAAMNLPVAAPRLSFAVMVRTRSSDWPQGPSANPWDDASCRIMVGAALQGLGLDAVPEAASPPCWPPRVLAPARLRDAIRAGLAQWLAALHDCVGITGWVVEPHAQECDLVRVRLMLDDADVPQIVFAIRQHQIGRFGLDDILGRLGALAPYAEQPSA